uniref:Pyrrolo-quinoline quinone repeat domain-containing protein n=1 Tax=Alexandrium catenella TaxID=2925 RepID=A0A7S1WVG5_ALECA
MAAARRAAGWLGLLCHVAPTAGRASSGKHPFPTRGINYNRSGYTPDYAAPFPLPAEPSWTYEVPALVRHQTSSVDEDLNVYSGSDKGVLQSYNKLGRLRWTVQAGFSAVQNPTVKGNVLYTSTGDGLAQAYDKDSGRLIWESRISEKLPGDTYSPSAFDDFVIYPAGALWPYGCTEVVSVSQSDGSVRWRYSVGDKYGGATGEFSKNGIGPKYSTVNLAPCYWNNTIIFNDVSGAMYGLSAVDGKELWYTPGDDKDMYTLGGSCCGPNGKIYLGLSTSPGKGAMQVLDVRTGEKLWRKPYPKEVHSAPAVGYINGVLTAVNGVGSPTGPYPYPKLDIWGMLLMNLTLSVQGLLGRLPVHSFTGYVIAVNAETGEDIWRFEPPSWHEPFCAGSSAELPCLPDLWSGPTIDAAGTVWINWSAGGILYGLRDANGDGKVDRNDPAETTAYDCGSAATGPPSVADGMIVTTTCRRVVAFVS